VKLPELTRGDVRLRPLRPDDALSWLAYLTDSVAIELTSYDIRSIDEVSTMLDDYAARLRAGEPSRWAIASTRDDNLIGTCGFHTWSPRDRRAELGYDLAPPFWGRGIVSDAVAATVAAAFESDALNRVDAFVMVENVRSYRVLEKCGFNREGRLAQYRNCRGRFRDFYLYGCMRPA
jgi:ribosomal-protein-alanine N-acetyltransferase